MFLRFIFKTGGFMDSESVPTDFNFGYAVHRMRSEGFYMNYSTGVYVPHDNVAAVYLLDEKHRPREEASFEGSVMGGLN